jgi:hypothetical protein
MADFSFLQRDVIRHRELAQDAQEEARRIETLLATESDPARRAELERSKQKWIDVATALAQNITDTSTAASSTLSTIVKK